MGCIWGKGVPLRETIEGCSPLLLSRILQLNETQTAILFSLFKISQEKNLPLIDLKDLQALINWCGNNFGDLMSVYGNITKVSLGTIQRSLVELEAHGGEHFFGQPTLDINDLINQQDETFINILDATKLMNVPKLYSTVLLWLLNELFNKLPEVGDTSKPKLIFFFDEAHLLFNDAPKVLIEKIEQLVRLIRSKAVGVYFITQNPSDIPQKVLSQLGNKIQHALRVYTPNDHKNLKATADSFRPNPNFDTATKITELPVGGALVSLLDKKATPTIAEEVFIAPPFSLIGTISADEKQQLILKSAFYKKYAKSLDQESAFEIIKEKKNSSSTDSSELFNGVGKFTKTVAKEVFTSVKRSITGRIGRKLVGVIFDMFRR